MGKEDICKRNTILLLYAEELLEKLKKENKIKFREYHKIKKRIMKEWCDAWKWDYDEDNPNHRAFKEGFIDESRTFEG